MAATAPLAASAVGVAGGSNEFVGTAAFSYSLESQGTPRIVGLEDALKDTFFFMDQRRLQRQAYGRHKARGVVAAATELAMFLGLALYFLASLRRSLLGPPSRDLNYLFLPILFTFIIIGLTIHWSFSTRENLPFLWGKAWGYLLVVWDLWLYEPLPSSCDPGQSVNPFDLVFGGSSAEKTLFSLFLALEGVTCLVWVATVLIYPNISGYCNSECRFRWFWRSRPSEERAGWWSYFPNGVCCSLRRHHFQYDGQRDDQGRPHGHGVWRDNSYHGEVLDGEWFEGLPQAPFVSRCFGNGAISQGLRIGYGTARAEDLSQAFCFPRRREGPLRFGTVYVECSAAGGFLAHLPQTMKHKGELPVEGALEELTQASEGLRQQRAETRRLCASFGASGTFRQSSDEANIVSGGTCSRALVFVHGYNCPLDWACMRIGQLIVLGKFVPLLLPLVFSWPCGQMFSYFQVRQQLPSIARDFVHFFRELRKAGIREVHLVGHSLGCELISAAAALPEMQEFVPSREPAEVLPGGGSSGEAAGSFRLKTITFFNATCSSARFWDPRLEVGELQNLVQLLGHDGVLTLYNDREDIALWGAEILGRVCGVSREAAQPIGRYTNELSVPRGRIDIVDCTSMDSNVDTPRHGYFNLNAHIIGDLQELIVDGKRAWQRQRLVRASSDRSTNVFAFLAAPGFLS